MFELIPLLLISTVFAFFSHAASEYNNNFERYERKDFVFFSILVFLLIIFAGTRTGYNDTWVYRGEYEDVAQAFSFGYIKSLDWSLGNNPGFYVIMSIMKSFGVSTQTFLMIFALITLAAIYWFVRKYTNDIVFSTYLLFVMTYNNVLSAIKQTFATALCLVAVDRYLENKKTKFVLWILIAILIHPYAVMYFIVPFLNFKPWTRKTWLLLIGFMLFGFSLQFLAGRIIGLTALIGEEYTVEQLNMSGINPFRVLVSFVPIFISFIYRKRIEESYTSRTDDILLNLTMLNASLTFVGLFGTALLIGRIANYFIYFQALTVPALVKLFNKQYRWIIKIIAFIAYFGFFAYECYHSGNDVFDLEFSRMTFWEYLSQELAL